VGHFAYIAIKRDLVTVVVSDGWNEIVYNHILPHIFLEYFDQVSPESVDVLVLEYFSKERFAILNGCECVSDEVVALLPLVAVYLDVTGGPVVYA